MPDKYSAVWVSHSSMGDFKTCPRSYYLKNVYKNPTTGRKMNIITPPLALGQAVHATLENLNQYSVEERFDRDLQHDLKVNWGKVSGKRGGFTSEEQEREAYERARAMITRVEEHPGPLKHKTVRLPTTHNNMPPNFYLCEEDNIILCGLVDWLVYVPEDDSVQILDFKTGKHDESEGSLQLPIYLLLLNALQRRHVSGAWYWYIDRDTEPTAKELPELADAKDAVLTLAREVKRARELKAFRCPRGESGCFACKPFEALLRGEGEYIGADEANRDVYVLV